MPPEGTEHPTESAEKPEVGQKSGAESGAVGAAGGVGDEDLAEIVSAWQNLQVEVRGESWRWFAKRRDKRHGGRLAAISDATPYEALASAYWVHRCLKGSPRTLRHENGCNECQRVER